MYKPVFTGSHKDVSIFSLDNTKALGYENSDLKLYLIFLDRERLVGFFDSFSFISGEGGRRKKLKVFIPEGDYIGIKIVSKKDYIYIDEKGIKVVFEKGESFSFVNSKDIEVKTPLNKFYLCKPIKKEFFVRRFVNGVLWKGGCIKGVFYFRYFPLIKKGRIVITYTVLNDLNISDIITDFSRKAFDLKKRFFKGKNGEEKDLEFSFYIVPIRKE